MVRLLILLVLVAAGFIYFSGGMYVGQHTELGRGSSQGTLTCRYLTVAGIVEHDYWYSPNNIMGRSHCPVFIDG